MEDVHRAGGIPAILGELRRGGLLQRGRAHRALPDRSTNGSAHGTSAAAAPSPQAIELFHAAPGLPALGRGVLAVRALGVARHRRGGGLHPRRRARVLRRRRPGDPVRQHRGPRLRREDRRRRRVDSDASAVRRSSSSPRRRRSRGSSAAGCKQGDVVVIRYEGPRGGPGHAGDALPDLLPEGPGPGQGLRAGHRRALLRRHLRPVDRPRLAGGRVRRRDRAGPERRHDRRSTFPSADSSSRSPRRSSPSAARRWSRSAATCPQLRDRGVSPALRAYAAMATSADTGAVRDVNAVERAVAAAAEARSTSAL